MSLAVWLGFGAFEAFFLVRGPASLSVLQCYLHNACVLQFSWTVCSIVDPPGNRLSAYPGLFSALFWYENTINDSPLIVHWCCLTDVYICKLWTELMKRIQEMKQAVEKWTLLGIHLFLWPCKSKSIPWVGRRGRSSSFKIKGETCAQTQRDGPAHAENSE